MAPKLCDDCAPTVTPIADVAGLVATFSCDEIKEFMKEAKPDPIVDWDSCQDLVERLRKSTLMGVHVEDIIERVGPDTCSNATSPGPAPAGGAHALAAACGEAGEEDMHCVRGLYFLALVIPARHDSAEHFSRLKALHCTAMGLIFIPAYCFAVP